MTIWLVHRKSLTIRKIDVECNGIYFKERLRWGTTNGNKGWYSAVYFDSVKVYKIIKIKDEEYI